jgi:hypothetical protein
VGHYLTVNTLPGVCKERNIVGDGVEILLCTAHHFIGGDGRGSRVGSICHLLPVKAPEISLKRGPFEFCCAHLSRSWARTALFHLISTGARRFNRTTQPRCPPSTSTATTQRDECEQRCSPRYFKIAHCQFSNYGPFSSTPSRNSVSEIKSEI